jgi:hypothetical protein
MKYWKEVKFEDLKVGDMFRWRVDIEGPWTIELAYGEIDGFLRCEDANSGVRASVGGTADQYQRLEEINAQPCLQCNGEMTVDRRCWGHAGKNVSYQVECKSCGIMWSKWNTYEKAVKSWNKLEKAE